MGENKLKSIEVTSINSKAFFVLLIAVMLIGTLLSIIVATKLQSPVIIVIGIILFWLCPTLLFQKQLRNLFTRRMEVDFLDNSFSIEMLDKNINRSRPKIIYKYKEINSYKLINSAKDNSSVLKINFKNGKTVSYTFLNQNETNNEINVLMLFNDLIKNYNSSHSEEQKIKLLPNLFASKAGTFYIIGLTILLISVILLQVILKPQSIPFTIFAGLFLYIFIIAQRKRDIRDFEKFNKP